MDPKYPHIAVQISGEDGNVFSILGRVTGAMRRAQVPQAEISAFTDELMASESYGDALRCVMRHVQAA